TSHHDGYIHSSHAQRMRLAADPDTWSHLRFYCAACDAEQIIPATFPLYKRGHLLQGWTPCLRCGERVRLTIVGRNTHAWPYEAGLVKRINGREVQAE